MICMEYVHLCQCRFLYSYVELRKFVILLEISIPGNDNIHQISTSTNHRLSIYLEDFTGRFAYANYSVFNVGDEQRKYQLGVYVFTGTHGLGRYIGCHRSF